MSITTIVMITEGAILLAMFLILLIHVLRAKGTKFAWVSEMATYLKDAMADTAGGASSMRLNFTYANIILGASAGFAIVWTAIKHNNNLTAVLTPVLLFLASAYGFKRLQRKDEGKERPGSSGSSN